MGMFDFITRKKKTLLKKEKIPYVPFTKVDEVKGDYDKFYSKLLELSLIILVTGKRGSGKTALGMKMLEMYKNKTRRKCYVMGYENTKLPGWIKKADDIEDIPENAVALIDEGALSFSARESMNKANKALSKLMAIARHKNLTLILLTQSSAMIDLNVLRLTDTLLFKEPSLLQSKFERKAIKDMYEKVAPFFKHHYDKRSIFYIWDDEFEGMVKYDLPEFWSDKISKSFKDYK